MVLSRIYHFSIVDRLQLLKESKPPGMIVLLIDCHCVMAHSSRLCDSLGTNHMKQKINATLMSIN